MGFFFLLLFSSSFPHTPCFPTSIVLFKCFSPPDLLISSTHIHAVLHKSENLLHIQILTLCWGMWHPTAGKSEGGIFPYKVSKYPPKKLISSSQKFPPGSSCSGICQSPVGLQNGWLSYVRWTKNHKIKSFPSFPMHQGLGTLFVPSLSAFYFQYFLSVFFF